MPAGSASDRRAWLPVALIFAVLLALALLAGQGMRFQFPFAARESLFALRISSSHCSYDSGADQCFRLELDNWILRALLDPIELGYDASLKRLARYRGLSNIGDANGDLKAARANGALFFGEQSVAALDGVAQCALPGG